MTSPSTADHSISDGPSSHTRADAARLLKLLTPREAQLLARLAAGDSLPAAARALGIAPATARRHLHRAVRKLGVRTRAEAVSLTAPPAPPPPAQDLPTAPDPAEAEADADDDAEAEPDADGDGEPEAEADAPAAAAQPRAFATFGEFCAAVHARLVQQTFLLTGSRRRAGKCVDAALGVAGRRWGEVSADADPEGWVRSWAFEAALSPWRPGGPRRARRRLLPRRRIRVAADAAQPKEPAGRLTAQDRALLKALLRLPRPQRQALVLHDALGLSVSAVALEVESSTLAAAWRVRAARATLASEVPVLVGEDADDPGFGERLGALLYRAARDGCPAPREPRPGRLTARGRLRAGVATGVPAVLVAAVGTAMVTTVLGGGPSAYFRPEPPAAPPLCTAGAGPAAPGRALGVRSAWCGPGTGGPTVAPVEQPTASSGPSTAPTPPDSGPPTPDQPAADTTPTDGQPSVQQPTDQQPSVQQPTDQQPTDQQPTDQPTAAQSATAQPAPDRSTPPTFSAGPVARAGDAAAAPAVAAPAAPCQPFRPCQRPGGASAGPAGESAVGSARGSGGASAGPAGGTAGESAEH